MIFSFSCIFFFILGIALAIPTASYAKEKGVIVTATAFLPFLILNFFANYHPIIDDTRYYLFTLAWGMVCYWVYYESECSNTSL